MTCGRPAKCSPTRRRLLRALAVGSGGSLAGCSWLGADEDESTPTATPDEIARSPASGARTRTVPDRLRADYDRTVNVVQAGGDHTGSRPIDDVLADVVGDDTALYFPRGEYRLEATWEVTGFSNLALVGDDALVRPPAGYADTLFDLGTDGASRGLRFEGIDFDVTAPNTGGRPIHGTVTDGLLVRDVTVYGRQDVDHDSMRFDVTAAEGAGRVERVSLPHGGTTNYPNTGIYVGEATTGTLTFAECRVAGFPDNGLYASSARGTVRVVGGHYSNNGIASVRVGSGAEVRDVRVTCDTNRDGLENMRGIRLHDGDDVLVSNAQVEMVNAPSSDGAITMADGLRTATVADTRIRTDADDVPAVRAKRPTGRPAGPPGATTDRVALRNLAVTGQAADGEAIEIESRNDCVVAEVCIRQEGADRNGIRFENSRGNLLHDVSVDVTGKPLVLDNASAQRRRFRNGSITRGC